MVGCGSCVGEWVVSGSSEGAEVCVYMFIHWAHNNVEVWKVVSECEGTGKYLPTVPHDARLRVCTEIIIKEGPIGFF